MAHVQYHLQTVRQCQTVLKARYRRMPRLRVHARTNHCYDVEKQDQLCQLFQLWELPVDLQRQSMKWLTLDSFRFLWIYLLLKVPTCRALFVEELTATRGLQLDPCVRCRRAVACALSGWKGLPEVLVQCVEASFSSFLSQWNAIEYPWMRWQWQYGR